MSAARAVRVAVGGTFQPLHDGHKLLLRTAYEIDGDVDIGLTSDEMARSARIRDVEPYAVRERRLREWIENKLGKRPNVMKLEDPYGTALTEDYDYIVVSPETFPVAVKINELRKEKGRKPIAIVRVDYVLAEDGKPISSTRIAGGEIDTHGNLLRKDEHEGSGRDQ
ncbi:MAG: Phosphopantetheine adenylyltransferase [Methanocella sp. PtaU1.Bin125]|nr:MAG: Phosphopantetheine adenylyltransferase [Methanocella sp. PtaU1.Bin125]